MSALCRIEMLGGLRANVGGRAITRFQTQKTGALLAFLALHPNRMHAREALAEMLWPGDDATAIRNRLNQAVSSLRRQLHPPGIEAGSTLQTDHHTISLNPQTVETDVDEFRRTMRSSVDDSSEKAISRLELAVDLYKGEFLSGYYDDWVLSERLFLHEQYIEALDRLIKLYVETGRPDRAIGLASKRLEADPLDESGHIRLMRLYLRLNRPRAALRQFEDLRRLFEAEDDEPGEMANKLAAKARLLAVDSVEELEVWQEPENPNSVAPATENHRIEQASSQAPRFFTRFIGRESEISRLDAWLLRGDVLATIVGVGGCGKTRLAAEFVAGLGDRLPVVWVSLAHLTDAKQVLTEVVVSAGGDRYAASDPLVQLRAILPDSCPVLVVLDNLEHLVDEPNFDIRPLLTSILGIRVIATSRRQIGYDGELVMTLSPLPVPKISPATTLQELAENPSVDLFVSRAQLVKQDFQLTDRTAEAISSLCQRLEGLPLAIELAASWARSLTPGQMLDEMTKRLDFLATRRRDISERHRSIRAAIDSSYDLLPQDLKEFFVRLSVFHGGCTHASARALAPELDVREALDELARRSLILANEDEGETRFTMLELLRTYAKSKASQDLLSEIEWLHASYYLEFVAESETNQNGMGASLVDRETGNVLAALRFFIQAEAYGHALKLAELLGGYFEYRDQISEGLAWMTRVEALARNEDPLLLARLRRRIALLSWIDGDFDQVEAMLNLSIPVLREFVATSDLIDALLLLRLEAHRARRFEDAMRIADEILQLASQTGDDHHLAHILRQRSNSLIELGRIEEGLDGYRQSLEIGRRIGSSDAIGFALLNMGFLATKIGQFDAAGQWLSEAEEVLSRAGRIAQLFDVMICQLRLAIAKGDFETGAYFVKQLAAWEVEGWAYHWESFSVMGGFFISVREYEVSARLLGFARSILDRVKGGASDLLLEEFNDWVDMCRSGLGAAFDEQFSIGRSMTLSQVRQLAIETPFLAPI